MNKFEIKNILITMRTPQNENIVNNFLGKLDLMDETTLQKEINKLGGTKDAVKAFFEKKITNNTPQNEHEPINEMFSYGISGNCVHLHLPMDLHQMIEENGISRTIDIVNLNLLDAIDKITQLKNDGFYKFQETNSIYMISPILLGKELKFLNKLDFETNIYKKKQLCDTEFVQNNKEAKLATNIFGKEQNVGTAKILFDTIQTKTWKEKKDQVIKDFESKGITLKNNKDIEK